MPKVRRPQKRGKTKPLFYLTAKEKKQIAKPYLPLPTTLAAREKRPKHVYHRFGIELPLKLGGRMPVKNVRLSRLLRGADHNGIALLGLMTTLIGKVSHSPHHDGGISGNRIVLIKTSQLIPTSTQGVLLGLSYTNMQRLVKAVVTHLHKAYQLCRRFGYRLVWLHDMDCEANTLQLLRMIHHAVVPAQLQSRSAMFKVVLPYTQLLNDQGAFGLHYWETLDLHTFSVLFDMSQEHAELTEHLLKCEQHDLPFIARLGSNKRSAAWLMEHRKQLWRRMNSLIIVPRAYVISKAELDKQCRSIVGATKHVDVLIERKGNGDTNRRDAGQARDARPASIKRHSARLERVA